MPNITGKFGGTAYVNQTTSGAFSLDSTKKKMAAGGSSSDDYDVIMNASLSNSIYGNSNTVQPATCKCYFMIKY